MVYVLSNLDRMLHPKILIRKILIWYGKIWGNDKKGRLNPTLKSVQYNQYSFETNVWTIGGA